MTELRELLKQGYVAHVLKSLLQQIYGRHYEPVNCYEISISQMAMDLFPLCILFSSFYHRQDFCRT